MADKIQVLLFGDVTCDYDAGLRSLVARKDNPVLTSFFERVTFAIRAEIGKLPFSDRDGFVKFTTFAELLTRLKNAKTRHHALEKALTCVHQFASFIRYVQTITRHISASLTVAATMHSQELPTLMRHQHALSVFARAFSLVRPWAAHSP